MVKRRRVAFLEDDGKCTDEHSSVDQISMLPDELLVSILSFLTLEEATATSILSSRWRYLWALSPKLNFDGRKQLPKLWFGKEGDFATRLKKGRRNYVRWVNQGIALHKHFPVKEFRVFYCLSHTEKRHINRWLRYAVSRKVERLVLNLKYINNTTAHKFCERYNFPYKLLRKKEFSNPSHSWGMRQCNSVDFKYLREIFMHYVNVNGEALEFFLCNCPILEHLSISRSGDLSSLKISGPFPAFKRLEICYCNNLNSLEIRDVDLVYFMYIGSRIHFRLDNVPLLSEVYVGGILGRHIEDVFSLLSSILPQLEILTIDARWSSRRGLSSWKPQETVLCKEGAKMSNLRQLALIIGINDEESLLPLTNLICSAPCLQRFVLVAAHLGKKIIRREVEKIARSYAHLREVELFGCYGKTTELEFVMHFLENATSLEKIVVASKKLFISRYQFAMYYYSEDTSDSRECTESELAARAKTEMTEMARVKRELTKIVPPGIGLEFL